MYVVGNKGYYLYSTTSHMPAAAVALCVTDRCHRSAYATAYARNHRD